MKRVVRRLLASAVSATVVFAFVACADEGAPCKTDRDCDTGQICRDEVCGSPRPGGGAADASEPVDTAPACTSDGVFCQQPSECCSGACTRNVCGLVPGGNPTCKNQLETCLTSDECCQPYTCSKGLCR